MALVFPNNTVSEISPGKVTYPSNMIQMVDVPITATLSVNNWATQNQIATASITPASTSSKILIYVNMHIRGDITQGTWSLGWIWLNHVNTGSSLFESGWNGTWRHTIYDWSRHFLHSPSSTATQTYSLRCGNYPTGTHTFNTGNAHDGISHLRLIELAS